MWADLPFSPHRNIWPITASKFSFSSQLFLTDRKIQEAIERETISLCGGGGGVSWSWCQKHRPPNHWRLKAHVVLRNVTALVSEMKLWQFDIFKTQTVICSPFAKVDWQTSSSIWISQALSTREKSNIADRYCFHALVVDVQDMWIFWMVSKFPSSLEPINRDGVAQTPPNNSTTGTDLEEERKTIGRTF